LAVSSETEARNEPMSIFNSDGFWALIDPIIGMIEGVTEYPVSIYDPNGRIIRATDKTRVGDLHAGAQEVMRGKVAEYAVTPEEAAKNPLVHEGYSCPIYMLGQIVAGLGITGDLSIVKPVARLSAKMIEAWIERHNYQIQLEHSEKKYRDIFNHSLHGIYQVTVDGEFITANKALSSILGYPDPETLMKTITDIGIQVYILREDREAFLNAIQNVGQVTGFETKFRHRNGGVIDVRINARLKTDSVTGTVFIEGVLEDITERKKIEEKLERNVNFTTALLKAIPTPVFYKDRDGLYQGCNQAFSDVMGVSADDIQGKSVHDLWPSEHADVYHRNDLALMENPEHQVYEFMVKDKHGEARPVIFAKDVFRDEDGEVAGLVGAFLDITQLKRTEEELRKANDIINRSPVVAFRWKNAHGWPVEYVSENVKALFGYSSEDFISGRTQFADAVHPEDLERVAQEVRQNSDDERINNFEHEPYRIVTKNGELKWVNDLTQIRRDFQGTIIHYEGIVYDITDRKQAEEDMRNLRNYLVNIIDSMPSVLIGVDNNGRVTQWNRQAQLATGLSSESAKQLDLTEAFPRLGKEIDRIKKAIQDREVIRDIKVPHDLHGETCYEDLTIFPLAGDDVEGAVIRVDDVTERVHLEELIIQNEKMLSVGGLAAGMAHEINNPLAGILQNISVLSNRLLKDLPTNQKAADEAGITLAALRKYLALRKLPKMLEEIQNSGMRATTIVRNTLGFARKSDRTVSSHDLCTLLDQTIDLVKTDYDMKKKYDFKKIRIEKAYEEANTMVRCEASKIQQVFLNLLKNGAEAMSSIGSQVSKGNADIQKTPMFILRVKNNGPWVRVEIEDNGPGIDDKTRRHIFEPFFTTKPVGKGTGLGLSVSYFIITEDHCGEMWVENRQRGGARFVIRLPVAGPSSQE
jgi:PAS domain S-box-containing protein